jgi:hypothetical protein
VPSVADQPLALVDHLVALPQQVGGLVVGVVDDASWRASTSGRSRASPARKASRRAGHSPC